MIIKPRVRGFVCVTTHPAGCEANVKHQIDYVKAVVSCSWARWRIARRADGSWLAGERRRRSAPSAVEEETTCGLVQGSAVVNAALSQFALDPCRGWGRYPSACIRTQKGPVVSPVGPALSTVRPEGSPCVSQRRSGQGARGPLEGSGNTRAGDPLCGLTTSLPSRRRQAAGNAHTLQKDVACWAPRRGEACASTGVDTRGMDALTYFDRCRGWRADRRFAPDCWPSMGRVPLQSGYLLQDQNGPVLPVR